MIGFLSAALLYPLYLALRLRKRKMQDLAANLAVYAYPVATVVAGILILSIDGLRLRVLGGGVTASSNEARSVQWHMGIPMVLHNPIGHGIGMAGQTLGFRAANGMLTIDTYYLSVLLELGVVGFIVYFGMFLYAAAMAGLTAYSDTTDDRELKLLAPAMIALLSFGCCA